MNLLKAIIDWKTIKFIIVGIVNTLIGTAVMFVFYNFFHLSYWISSVSNYIVGSIVSYILNKYWTFQNKENSYKVVIRFLINIAVCYFLAYGIAKPLVKWILRNFSGNIQDNFAMIIGMILFVVFNYFGQRFFAFKDEKNKD